MDLLINYYYYCYYYYSAVTRGCVYAVTGRMEIKVTSSEIFKIKKNKTKQKKKKTQDCEMMDVSSFFVFIPLIPVSDQDRFSPYFINTISSRQVMRIKKNINCGIIG